MEFLVIPQSSTSLVECYSADDGYNDQCIGINNGGGCIGQGCNCNVGNVCVTKCDGFCGAKCDALCGAKCSSYFQKCPFKDMINSIG